MLTKLQNITSAESALVAGGLAWSAVESPLYDASGALVRTHKILSRSDTGSRLSIVKKTYQPVNNSIFALMDALRGKSKMFQYVSAGTLDGGRRVVLQAAVDSAEITRGDEIQCYLTMLNAFDGSSALRAMTINFRLVCENMLTRALREASMVIAIRHTASIEARTIEAMRLLSMSTTAFGVFVNKARILARKSVHEWQVKRFIDELVPDTDSARTKNARERILALFQSGKGNHGRSAFDLVNGYSEAVDHGSEGNQDRLTDSRLFGYRAAMKSQAFDLALAL